MKNKTRPTDSELGILQILWTNGPSSVRFVHNQLSEKKDVFYTTTLKTMQVMLEKGFVTRDTSSRSHVYDSAVSKTSVQQRILVKLKESVFGGSTEQLILSALGTENPSTEDLNILKSIIEKLEHDDTQLD